MDSRRAWRSWSSTPTHYVRSRTTSNGVWQCFRSAAAHPCVSPVASGRVTTVYLFAAAAGVPLIVWFLLAGGEEGDTGDGGSDNIGGVMLRLLPLSTIAMVLATFGVTGLLLGAVGTGGGVTFLGAASSAVVGGSLNSVVFRYLRRSDSTAAMGDDELRGAIGRVVVPVAANRRGRVAVSAGGQQLYLSARGLPGDSSGDLEVGASVVVVEIEDGVATVTRLDAELA